ncbi:MAG: hypothetical protein Q9163_002861 [Psora crenata]
MAPPDPNPAENHLRFDEPKFEVEGGADRKQSAADHKGSIYAKPDLENGEEYANLVAFINSYYEGPRRKSVVSMEEQEAMKKPWWKFWKRSPKPGLNDDGFEVPDDWLEADIKEGISMHEVEARRKRTGFNELTTEKENMFLKFLSYFTGPILYVMEIAVILAAGLRDWIDFGVIIAILLLNATVGWYQEKQAADVVASLKGDIAMRATVVRSGKEEDIKARELVPGDIIIIEEGQVIPADARLICAYENPGAFEEYKELMRQELNEPSEKKPGEEEDDDEDKHHGVSLIAADQSAITGESLAVDKFMGDTAYYTTGCKRGKAYAVVTAPARTSFVGRTATLVQGAKDQGHFKAIMNSIGTALLVIVVAWILISWIGGFFHGLEIATPEKSSRNLLHYVLILLIVGVPVGLPVVTTTTLAVGAAYLAKDKAIVQKLTAIESLALSIREPYVAEDVDVNWMMAVAALASSHNIKSLDPIDKVTILTLKRYPKAREILEQGWKTQKYTPFDPVSKRITCECSCDGQAYIAAKGAPKAILSLTECSKETADLFKNKAAEFARRGFRSLGVAVKKNNEPWELLGMLSMFDPPREDTAQTIAEAQILGLQVKMLTGDAIAIAKETCKMLALGTKVYNSDRLIHGGLSGTTQHDLVERADGFAEVFPEHKYQVVEMIQQRGHLTAMTGDGVNDAPSLKKSDCGIAVEGASEAAQAAADIVFLAPGLSTIVSAIKIARQIFQRMKAYIQYRIALCFHLEIYLVTSMVIINETITVDLIVFLALFADLATIAVAYDNAHYEARPVEWQLPKIWIISVTLGALLALGTWVIRGSIFVPNGGVIQNYGNVQEILFLEISLTENWLIFVTRGGKTWPSWQLVGAIFGVDVLATIFCIFGWLSGEGYASDPRTRAVLEPNGRTSVVTAVVIWAYSIGVTIVIAIIYYLMNKIEWLDNLGRKSRSRSDTQMENILGHLSKVAIEHERDDKGGSRWHLTTRATEAEIDE